MSQIKTFKVRITDSKPKICYPTVKEKRCEQIKLVKERSEILKNWPKDALLKWTDKHLMCESCGLMFSNISNLRRHSKLHNKEEQATWRCPDCYIDLGIRYDNLQRHLRESCPIMKRKQAATKPTHPITIEAANNIILKASSTKKRQPMPWALTPIDLEIAPPKPKRCHRDNRISAADIPLNAKIILIDPRKFCPPTPITDQDAKKLEQMLEENDTVADNSSPQTEKQPIVTESQTPTLEMEATCEARTDIISMPLLESLFPDQNKSPVSDSTPAHQKVVDKTDIATQVSQPRKNFVVTREILFSNLTDDSLVEGFNTDINID